MSYTSSMTTSFTTTMTMSYGGTSSATGALTWTSRVPSPEERAAAKAKREEKARLTQLRVTRPTRKREARQVHDRG